jgi:thiol-disulfide isomerase/thioredoxin
MMKRIINLLIAVLIIGGCTDKNSVKINGKLTNKDHKKIYLDRIDVDTYVRIDSAVIKNNGSFRFRFKAIEPDFYQLGISNSDFITLLTTPGEKINLTFPGKHLYENFEITGSVGSEKVKNLDIELEATKKKIDSIKVIYEANLKSPGFELKESSLNNEYIKLVKEQRTKNIKFILENLNSFASIKALYQRIDENTYVLYDPRDLQFFKLVSDTLTFHFPKSKQVIALKKNFEKELGEMYRNRIEQAAKNAPEIKLDPNLKDINGKRISLSSLKGKYVLLSFWATSSEDCVAENLMFKTLYKEYKSKGFEIYSINLDENDSAWKNAIKFDELSWINVREDDPSKPVNANLYNVKNVPTNYLYDKNGTIIGVNLHGKSLQIKLMQLFGN